MEDVDFDEFRRTILTEYTEHSLDVEKLQVRIFEKINGQDLSCCMDYRSQKMAKKFWGVVSESILALFKEIK